MSADLFSLIGKVVLLTGGYGYLGKSVANGLAEFGARVFVLGKSEDKFRQAFPESTSICFEKCDVGNTISVEAAFARIANSAGEINVLINNAFFCRGNEVEKISDDDWEFSIEGTLNSVHRCIRAALPYFKKHRRGKIINVSSIYGMVSPRFSIYEDFPLQLNPSHYGAAKAGVIQLTRYFAGYLGPHNINVNCVTPGAFPSAKTQESAAFIAELTALNPLQRIGHPDDLKGAFIFLSSAASDYVTGHNLVVDGGWTAW